QMRDKIARVEARVGPMVKKLIPNFIAAHYVYILTISILGSILIYPQKNIAYIDALFFAACAATQAGMNTVDVNTMTLFQQLSIYFITLVTTPIFIHSGVLFVRLYWFERHFDNIKHSSKLNFKMRRTATLAARTMSNEIHENTMANTGIGTYYGDNDEEQDQFDVKAKAGMTGDASNRNCDAQHDQEAKHSPDLLSLQGSTPYSHTASQDGVIHMSEPSDSEDERLPPDQRLVLPHPRRERIEPSDMFMSILMMHQSKKAGDEESGPALKIRGPAERERPSNSRKGSIIQFAMSKRMKGESRRWFRKSQSYMTDDTTRNGLKSRRGLSASRAYESSEFDERADDYSINSELDASRQMTRDSEASRMSSESDTDGQSRRTRNDLSRAISHSVPPSSDATGGTKFLKRATTSDIPTKNDRRPLVNSPTFDRLIRTQKRKLAKKKYLRRYASAVTDSSSGPDESDTDISVDVYGLKRHPSMSANYLSWQPTIGRNSTFVALTDAQKEELGGVEYRAIKLLCKLLVIYYVGFHLVAGIMLLIWALCHTNIQVLIRAQGVNPRWWAFFTSASSFNDLGITLTYDSMMSFLKDVYVLLVSGFFIVIGNTGFPILLRFLIWIQFKFSSQLSLYRESLGFLLDHPRRCFTMLFSSAPTWWLLFILVTLNTVDVVLFVVLDIHAELLKGISPGFRVLDGLYQAFATRTAGFSVLDVSALHPSVQISYMLMMYISVLPMAISIRRTNVYEEQSLGVYKGADEGYEDAKTPKSFVSAHLRRQLSFDLWFIFLGLFIICIAEGGRLQSGDSLFSVFAVLFEIVSAYGTVGLSLGYPGSNTSFCGQFTVLSKLVIIAMMIRGRHRGLPYALDRAIMLPSDKMNQRDEIQ
ncbi:hypothetical protein BABINDRAFT_18187, partial [Babjeviella inositovora NRRL Y-12698]